MISPAGTFTSVAGQRRQQIFMLNLDARRATGAGLWIASSNRKGSSKCGGVGGHAGICFLPYR